MEFQTWVVFDHSLCHLGEECRAGGGNVIHVMPVLITDRQMDMKQQLDWDIIEVWALIPL